MIKLLLLLTVSVATYAQCTLVVNPKTRQLTCAGTGTGGGGGGGTGVAPYSVAVAAQTTLTVAAATHGQGTTQALLVSCLDGAGTPWTGATCDYTISSAGEVVFTWAPAFTGYIVIGGGGTNTPILSGLLSAIPATCTVGAAIYQATDEPPSTQIYACTATDTWTRAAYSQGTAVPGTCVIGEVFFDTDATAGQNLFGCTATNTWTAQAGGGGGGVTSVDATGGVQTVSGSAITATGTIRGAYIAKAEVGTTYTVLTGDRGKVITFSNAGAIAVTLPQAGAGFEDGWFVIVKNIGVGDVTVTPTTSTISGTTAITLSLGEFAIINSNGTNYEAETNRIVAGTNITLTKARTSVSVASTGGSGDVVGPASAVDSQLAAFDTTTGKLIKDSGLPSASTGTGNLVRATSPTLVTPALGTPSALVLTNATGLPIAGGGTGGTTAATARGALGIVNVLSYTAGGGTTVADSTTYYHTWNNQAYQTTENSVSKVSMPVAGTITSLVLMVSQNGATATSENVTVTLRINGSDTAITGTMAWDASSSNVNTGTFTGSVAVAAGDILSIKMVTPAWVTNPSNVRSIANIVLKMDQ